MEGNKTVPVSSPEKLLPEDFEFNLSDFALFLSVMKIKRAYECTLSIILDDPGLRLKEVKAEQVVLNKSGKRAIRLDAWALDENNRQINTEQCEEVQGLHLEDGTTKLFLNMKSKNGRQELYSLLQYMKHTDINNPDITIRDPRIMELDKIVSEVKQSEEWEAVKMNILEIGIEKGRSEGLEIGRREGIKAFILDNLEEQIPKQRILEKLEKRFGMEAEEALACYKKYAED